MKAIVLGRFGRPDVLTLKEVDKPKPSSDEVLIKVKAIGINPVDTKVRAGINRISKMIELPAIIGWDVSGIVESCGPDATGFQPGDEVFGCIGFPGSGGGYAEYAVTDPNLLAMKPAAVSFEEAAALPIAGLTAYQSIHEQLKLEKGQSILIQAASGGVGHLAVQFAKIAGAEVFGTASAINVHFLEALGIDRVIDYKTQKFEELLHDLDAVQDAFGGNILYRSISCIRPGGRIVCLPSSTKDDPVALKLAEKNAIRLTWPLMRADKNQLQEIIDMVDSGSLQVHLDKVFSFDEMRQAHEAIASHHTVGKIVVKVDD